MFFARLRKFARARARSALLFEQQPTQMLVPPVLARTQRLGEMVAEKFDIGSTLASPKTAREFFAAPHEYITKFASPRRSRYDPAMANDFDQVLNGFDDDGDCGCGGRSGCRDLRKLAKNTHVAGANAASSYRNVFTNRRCR